ncbi:hypothetical protein JL721_8444 [Aureococcus anophagefferens]|nr:hypothetical protein JL721_8444 [Aureococcus anophagefferens]
MARLLNKMMDVQRTLEAEIDASMGLNLTTTPSPDDAPVAAPPTADAPPGEPNGAGHDDALRRALAGKEAEREELLAEGTELAAKLGAAERRNKALKADRDDKADAVAGLERRVASLQAERRPERSSPRRGARRRRAEPERARGERAREGGARERLASARALTGELRPSDDFRCGSCGEAAPAPDGGDVAAAHAEALEAAEARARARVDDAERSAAAKVAAAREAQRTAERERDLLRDDADRAAAAAAAAPEVDADDLAARLHKTELERDAMERSLREAVADAAKAKRALRAPAAAAPDAAQHAAWRAEQRGRAAETDELRARLEAADSERRVLQVKLARALDDAGDAKDALHGATAAQAREVELLQTELAATRDDLRDVKASFHKTLEVLVADDGAGPAKPRRDDAPESTASPPAALAEEPASPPRDRTQTDTLPYGLGV